MKKVLIGCLMLLFLFLMGISPVSAATASEEFSLYPISHEIKVEPQYIAEDPWTEENVMLINLGPNPIPDSDYENRTLEGAKLYIAYDSNFLYILIDSIYVKQNRRLDYGLVAFDSANDNVTTHMTDQYYFTAFGANFVYFSQHVLYNTSIDPETGEEEGFSISHCMNMPGCDTCIVKTGIHRDLRLWGTYRSTWNEAAQHEVFTFRIPLSDFGDGTKPAIPYTFGFYAEVYKSTTDDEDANPDTGPLATYPTTANMSDQSTWAKVTLNQSSGSTDTTGTGTSSNGTGTAPGFELPIFMVSTAVVALIANKKKKK